MRVLLHTLTFPNAAIHRPSAATRISIPVRRGACERERGESARRIEEFRFRIGLNRTHAFFRRDHAEPERADNASR